jgi:hypothetical protein
MMTVKEHFDFGQRLKSLCSVDGTLTIEIRHVFLVGINCDSSQRQTIGESVCSCGFFGHQTALLWL